MGARARRDRGLAARSWCATRRWSPSTTRTIADLTKDLAQFERIKKIALLPREFSLEAGELTPTLKVKRRVVEQKYKDVIDRLYEGAAA